MTVALREQLSFERAGLTVETITTENGDKKLYMEGIFIEGGVKNQNKRVYPVQEISRAVGSINEKLKSGYSVLGELDHPDDLQINLDRVCLQINEMKMQGNNGIGKLQVLPTPMGNIVKALLESGVKLGVSSRGSGNVAENGTVSEYEIITVDMVAQPSAPNAYPTPIYERLQKSKDVVSLAEAIQHDKKAQNFFSKEMVKFIRNLDIRRN
jgi:hypothetical protein|tara:strand:- start:110 stop:742 length:633 start_codon:yes stop_codon:yes gene_type:complete